MCSAKTAMIVVSSGSRAESCLLGREGNDNRMSKIATQKLWPPVYIYIGSNVRLRVSGLAWRGPNAAFCSYHKMLMSHQSKVPCKIVPWPEGERFISTLYNVMVISQISLTSQN